MGDDPSDKWDVAPASPPPVNDNFPGPAERKALRAVSLITSDMASRLEDEIRPKLVDMWAYGIERPVERIFYLALAYHCYVFIEDFGLSSLRVEREGVGLEGFLTIAPHLPVPGIRAVFVLVVVDRQGNDHRLAVTCGADHAEPGIAHQSARASLAGLAARRFSDDEIFDDPIACVREVLSWAAEWAWHRPAATDAEGPQ